MANCISCGRETEAGQFFCPDCLQAMTPEERGAAAPEAVAPPPAKEEKQAGAKEPRPPEQAIDVVKASVLTPPSEKRVLKASPEPAGKKPGRAKAAKEKPPREGPTVKERAKAAAGKAGRGGAGAGRGLKKAALKTGGWLKRLARQESAPFQKADLVAWWVGLGMSLLLLAAVFFMDFLKFAWMPVSPDAFEAVFSYLKAYDLGPFGYLLIACAALILLFHVLSLVCARTGKRLPVNPSFLVAALCVAALVLIPLALASNGAIVRSSTARSLEPTLDLGYARKTILYGAYISLLCLVAAFGAASSVLAEEKALPYWMGSLFGWGKSKVQSRKEKASGGKHDKGKGKGRKGGPGD